jgi:aspartate aminotransferase-like enzyme
MREGMKAIGLDIYVKDVPSPALTTVVAPPEVGSSKVIKALANEFGITVADGQDQAKGVIFRVSHIGDLDKTDTLFFVSAIESVLHKLGYKFNYGAGTKKASEILFGE